MANIELMKTNLAKNEEKLAKKVALLGKYEAKKAKLALQWKKLTEEDYTESMKFIESKTDELSLWGKLEKYYNREVANLYFDISTFYDYGKWTSNPIVNTQEGIKELEERCQKYRDSIAEEEKKNADRKASMELHTVFVNGKDVNVIVEFLNNWERQVTKHLMKVFDFYVAESENWYNKNIKCLAEYKFENTWGIDRNELEKLWAKSEYTKFYPTWVDYNRKGCSRRDPCYNAIKEVIDEAKETYESMFHPKTIEKYAKTRHNPNRETFETNMRKAIENEKNRKYDQLIDDVEHLVGKIIDMSHIKVGVKGDLEGFVIGTDGEAELWTKGCGGFNENVIVNVKHGQTFHFRFYVRKRA